MLFHQLKGRRFEHGSVRVRGSSQTPGTSSAPSTASPSHPWGSKRPRVQGVQGGWIWAAFPRKSGLCNHTLGPFIFPHPVSVCWLLKSSLAV